VNSYVKLTTINSIIFGMISNLKKKKKIDKKTQRDYLTWFNCPHIFLFSSLLRFPFALRPLRPFRAAPSAALH